MKAIVVAAVSAALLAAVWIYQEGRISKLEEELAWLKHTPPKSDGLPGAGRRLGGTSGGGLVEPDTKSGRDRVAGGGASSRTGEQAGRSGSNEGEWVETFRKMMENPVGAAMLKEQQKGRALRLYGDFVDALNLKPDEKEYFIGLVAAGVGEQDTVGMRLFAAKSDEERTAILDQMEADQQARERSIQEFLNNDEDFARYQRFEERKEIHEQMPGLRAAMEASGTAITPAQEERLVDVIYDAAVQSGMQRDWDGRAGMEQFAQPGATDRFKEQWAATQQIVNSNLGAVFDNPAQHEAVREHQTQVANQAIMGLQFVEGMIAGQQQQNGGE